VSLSTDDQAALDTMLGGGIVRLVFLEREVRRLLLAVDSLDAAQRETLRGVASVHAGLADLQAVVSAPVPVDLTIVPRGSWLRRERLAEAVQIGMKDHLGDFVKLRELYETAGGVVGEVQAAPLYEAEAAR